MPWASEEPRPLAHRVTVLRGFRGRFDADDDYVYGIFDGDETEVVGGTGLHRRAGDDAFEIGYWIRTDRTRQGLATEATAALTRIGLEHCGVDRIDIRVDPANEASLAVPPKLGFTEEATLRRRLPAFGNDDQPRDVVVFTLLRSELPSSPAAHAQLEAYDALGKRVL